MAWDTVNDALDLGIPSIGSYAVTMTVEGPGGCMDDLATTPRSTTRRKPTSLCRRPARAPLLLGPVDPGQPPRSRRDSDVPLARP